ncbi:MAG: DUF6952 family protein [Nitrospirota bacterium]
MSTKEIRELAKRFTPEQLEHCIHQQLETGANVCIDSRPDDEIINELAKAEFVSEQIAKGVNLSDALRELAKRIRQVQQGFEEES